MLSLAFIVVCALFFSLSNLTSNKPTEKTGADQLGTVEPKTFYLVVNGQKVVDQCTADLSNDLNVEIVSDVDKYEYSVGSNAIPGDKFFTFSVNGSQYAFAGYGKADHTAGFTIDVKGKHLKVSATTIPEVLTKEYNSTTFAYDEKNPTDGFPYFVLKVTCGTKTISVLLTMPN